MAEEGKKTVAFRFSPETTADLTFLNERRRIGRNAIIESLIAAEARRERHQMALEAAQLAALVPAPAPAPPVVVPPRRKRQH